MQHDLFNTDTPHNIIKNLLPKDGVVEIYPAFFTKEESDLLFAHLLEEIEWQQDSMNFYGKEVLLPRLTAWYGEPMKEYSYSGIDMKVRPWTKEFYKKNC